MIRKKDMTKLNSEKIESMKRELVLKYIFMMFSILLFYTILFHFGIRDNFTSIFLISGAIYLLGFYLFAIKSSFVKLIPFIHFYLLLMPVYDLYFIISFFRISVGNIVWLLPVPLGAYIFFGKKSAVYYSLYIIGITILSIIFAYNFSNHLYNLQTKIFFRYTETTAFVFNGLVMLLLIYYHDKIKTARLVLSKNIYNNIEKTDRHIITVKHREKTLQEDLEFFYKIDSVMLENLYFKDHNFNISKLCLLLDSNNSYVSRAIKAKEYDNFNTYLNTLRVDYVKKLIAENDLSKITLMYIYTEAGFSNQPTFNRAFKKIEGTTPSEYMKSSFLQS